MPIIRLRVCFQVYFSRASCEVARLSLTRSAALVQRSMTTFAGRVHAYRGEDSGLGKDNRRELGTQTRN
jgi:hypothetical protein